MCHDSALGGHGRGRIDGVSAADEQQLWRPRAAARVSTALLTLIGAVLAAWVSADGLAFLAVMLWLLTCMCGIGLWRFAMVPYVAATDPGIVVQNPFLHSTIDWASVADIRGGYDGLQIVTTDGRCISAWAVQQANIARWLHEHTRSDDIARVLLDRRAQMVKAAGPSGAPQDSTAAQ